MTTAGGRQGSERTRKAVGDAPVSGRPVAAADRVSDEALEISQLVVELVHVAYATRHVDAETAPAAARGDPQSASAHAIRAAIHVYQHGGRTIGEIATGLGISLGWAGRVVRELEASGMVNRAPDPTDRRIVHVALTARALEMVRRAYLWRAEAIERALATLDASGRAAVDRFLRLAVEELAMAGRDGDAPLVARGSRRAARGHGR